MSMMCSVLGITPAQIAAIRRTPALASYLATHADAAHMGPDGAPGLSNALGPIGPVFDLRKSWHILHYLFTGDVGPGAPPSDALIAGEELGEDLGYGPPRLHDADATRAFAAFLTPYNLQPRLDLTEMRRAGVYAVPRGAHIGEREEAALREDVAVSFEDLRDYVDAVTGKRNGLLIWLS